MSIFRLYKTVSGKKKLASPFWSYSFTVSGKRYRGTTKKTNKYEAGVYESLLMAKIRERGDEFLTITPPVLRDFADEFLRWANDNNSLEPASRKYYVNGWKMLSTTKLANMPMHRITTSDVETTTFPGGAANHNRAVRTLSRMMSLAKEKKRIAQVPELKLKKEWRRSIKMTLEDAQKIASHMPDGDAKDAFLVLRGTGMRPREAFSMRWENVHLGDNSYFQNPRGKTPTAQRRIPLFPGFPGEADILARRHLEQGAPVEGWVFPSPRSCSGHMSTIAKVFTEARKAAGLPSGMVLYCARHGRASESAEVLPLSQLMQYLGHSDTKTALGYQHFDSTEVRARLERGKTDGGRIQ